LINEVLPKSIPFMNQPLGKKELAAAIRHGIEVDGQEATAEALDRIKDLGFFYATKLGYSWGITDLPIIEEKKVLIEKGEGRVREIQSYFDQGLLTQAERHRSIISVWSEIKDEIAEKAKTSLLPFGTVYTMIESGARGTLGQLTQMVGMKGLVSNPTGDIIELPVTGSFREGFSVLEFFISSHGVRKGLSDTALRTANAGYLTRRLVDVAQDVVVREIDCGDREGVILTKEESDEIGEPLLVRILGRVALSPIKKPGTKKVVVEANQLIIEDHIRELETAEKELEEAHVRSVLTCKSRNGICQECYGYDLAYNKLVKLGTAVGIIAAQSIGEPGTQLTMRTFHTGGVAGKDITQGLPRVEELFEARLPKRKAIMAEVSGKVEIEEATREIVQVETGKAIIDSHPGQKIVRIRYHHVEDQPISFPKGSIVKVEDGQTIHSGDALYETRDGEKFFTDVSGVIKQTSKEFFLVREAEHVREYIIPPGYTLYVKNEDEVMAGDALTEGSLDLQLLFQHKGQDAVKRYLSKEIQFIYASQGQKLNNKHIEIIVKQMFSRVRIVDPGDTEFLPGEVIEKSTFLKTNDAIKERKGTEAKADNLFLGITKISLSTDSWLSAASFQETARVLINASVTGKVDRLEGLKENVIIGRLIPAGTGFNVSREEIGESSEDEDENIS
ncbi:DNA-directed RNA polymerase subunit beta', partial [Candidatus Uhrbacteria bacterium CG_4_9_14_3_um_filter_36_7]